MLHATITQSSAEFELLATVQGAAEGIGLISLDRGLGSELFICLHIDASAALGGWVALDTGAAVEEERRDAQGTGAGESRRTRNKAVEP